MRTTVLPLFAAALLLAILGGCTARPAAPHPPLEAFDATYEQYAVPGAMDGTPAVQQMSVHLRSATFLDADGATREGYIVTADGPGRPQSVLDADLHVVRSRGCDSLHWTRGYASCSTETYRFSEGTPDAPISPHPVAWVGATVQVPPDLQLWNDHGWVVGAPDGVRVEFGDDRLAPTAVYVQSGNGTQLALRRIAYDALGPLAPLEPRHLPPPTATQPDAHWPAGAQSPVFGLPFSLSQAGDFIAQRDTGAKPAIAGGCLTWLDAEVSAQGAPPGGVYLSDQPTATARMSFALGNGSRSDEAEWGHKAPMGAQQFLDARQTPGPQTARCSQRANNVALGDLDRLVNATLRGPPTRWSLLYEGESNHLDGRFWRDPIEARLDATVGRLTTVSAPIGSRIDDSG